MICLVCAKSSLSANTELLHSEAHRIQMYEIRADKLNLAEIVYLPEWISQRYLETGLSAILTFRLPPDGGHWRIDELERREAMIRCIDECTEGSIAYIDLEVWMVGLEQVENAAQFRGIGIIRSFHDFKDCPTRSSDIASQMLDSCDQFPDAIIKAALMVSRSDQLLALTAASLELKQRGKRFVLLGMGEAGQPSRILTHKLGSLWTYASARSQDGPVAPGQLDPQTLIERYRFPSLDDATALFGIIGSPIGHSKSPVFHNAAFVQQGVNAVYLPFLVDKVEPFFAMADLLGLRGISITIPHKEAVLPFCSSTDASVDRIGSCNTMVRDAQSRKWKGYNTDAPGFYSPLARLFSERQANGLAMPDAALVIGAGGASRAICEALLAAGMRILILNRTLDRARELAAWFARSYPGKVASAALGASPDLSLLQPYSGLIVQTTTMGMEGELEHLDPLETYQFNGQEIVYDIVYTPEQTQLLQRAAAAGCVCINGSGMFTAQAELQSRLFCAAIP